MPQWPRMASAARAATTGMLETKCCLGGVAQQHGLSVAGEHLTFDADEGGDVRMPIAVDEFVGSVEDADAAALVAVASGVVAVSGADRGRGGGDLLDLLAKCWLVVLDLDDQGGADLSCDREVFLAVQGVERDHGAPGVAEFGEQ